MEAVRCFAKGWRTLSAVLAFIITGLLSVVGTLDLTPVIALLVKDPALLGAAMVGVGALFGFLRYLTTTPLMSPTPAAAPDEAPPPERPRDCDRGM